MVKDGYVGRGTNDNAKIIEVCRTDSSYSRSITHLVKKGRICDFFRVFEFR